MSKEMTVFEAQGLRERAQKKISEALRDFEKETGLTVTELSIKEIRMRGTIAGELTLSRNVEIRVEL